MLSRIKNESFIQGEGDHTHPNKLDIYLSISISFQILRNTKKKMESVECAGFVFSADFDSGNFLKAEIVNKKETRKF